MSLPPSASMSEYRNVTPNSSADSSAALMIDSNAPTADPHPPSRMRLSLPVNSMKATVALRCSPSIAVDRTAWRRADGMSCSRLSVDGTAGSFTVPTISGARLSSIPLPLGSPSIWVRRRSAVALLTRIWLAVAPDSICTVVEVAGPAMEACGARNREGRSRNRRCEYQRTSAG